MCLLFMKCVFWFCFRGFYIKFKKHNLPCIGTQTNNLQSKCVWKKKYKLKKNQIHQLIVLTFKLFFFQIQLCHRWNQFNSNGLQTFNRWMCQNPYFQCLCLKSCRDRTQTNFETFPSFLCLPLCGIWQILASWKTSRCHGIQPNQRLVWESNQNYASW